MNIHPAAIVSDQAQLAGDVEIGPFSVIGPDVVISPGCVIGAHVILEHRVVIGEGTRIGHGTVLGGNPQDLSFDQRRNDTGVLIGRNNIIREHVTVNRASAENGDTTTGEGCFLMTGCHLGHDCVLGDRVILANTVLLGGHVQIGDGAFLGGGAVFHQFMRIGRLVMARGGCMFSKDIPPYCVAGGTNQAMGLNSIGLRRAGFTSAARMDLKRAFKLLYLSNLNTSQALEAAGRESWGPEGAHFFEFVREAKKRGICDYVGKGPDVAE